MDTTPTFRGRVSAPRRVASLLAVALAISAAGANGCGAPRAPALEAARELTPKVLTLVTEPPADRADRPDRGTSRFAIRGSGSAFAIDDGRVLTAAHCVEGEREVGLRDAEGHVTKASVVRVDERVDLALLATDAPLPERLRFTLADASPELGTPVFVYGTTALAFPALAEGVVAAQARGAFGEQMSPMMVTSIVAWHGMSGAPLLDVEHGARVVGVSLAFLDVNFTDPDRRGNLLGAAPVEDVRGFLDERVSESVSRYAAYAALHRDDVDLGLVGARVIAGDESTPPHVALDVRSDRDATVTLTIRRGDETLAREALAVRSGITVWVVQLTPERLAGATLSVESATTGLRTFRFAAPDAGTVLATPLDLSFRVEHGVRSADHDWVPIEIQSSLPIDGDIVLERALVLSGTSVVGRTFPCMQVAASALDPSTCDAEGWVWAPRGGRFDVVLLAGDQPIAARTLVLPER